ncbi:MAG: hypothetical protein WB249_13730 [Candidatus Sulfotelmatobacter sp.]
MAKPCSICTSPNVREIDDLLDSGESQLSVSERFSVSKFALSRHARRLCQQSTEALEPDEQIWLDRLERAHAQAVTDGDVRGMQQTATAGLRVVRQRQVEKAKARAAAVKQDADSGVDDFKIPVSSLDDVMQMFDAAAAQPDPINQEKSQEAYRRAKLLNLPDAMTIFHKMLEWPEFCSDLLRWVALWEPAKKGEPDESQSLPQATAPN